MEGFRKEMVDKVKENGITWIRKNIELCKLERNNVLFASVLKQAEKELGYDTHNPVQTELPLC
jgi:hypothetical protein